MHSFFDLAGFEYKKIFQRKSAVIALVLITLAAIVSPALILLGNQYIDGEVFESHYDGFIKDRQYERALSGRNIDEVLLSEMRDGYSKMPLVERYGTTPEYQQYARPYSAVFWMARSVYNFNLQSLMDMPLEEMRNFSRARHEASAKNINAENMSEKSKEKMIKLDGEIKSPLVFSYIGGYDRFMTVMFSIGLFGAFAVAVCLAPMFAGEYGTRTDQLILSSKLGKNKLISAKLFTAFSFCIILCLFLIVCTYLMSGFIMGFDGADAPLQIMRTLAPYPLTIAQAAAICAICITFAVLLTGALTLFLSSKFKSPFGVIIIISVLLFIPTMFVVSPDNMLLYNLSNLLPANMMDSSQIFSHIPYEFFGLPAVPYIFIPVFCALVCIAVLPFTRSAFRNHQVG